MKRGISLIAVLMFMLAATTASIVVFRVIGSENFSSGARLKASEAYQASESGIDAVRSWLANKPMEAGELVRQFEIDKTKSIEIKLGDGKIGGSREQNFKAYLQGVEVNNGKIKLKILVRGEARNGSTISQTAVFNIDGLYQVNVLSPPRKPYHPPADVPGYFGGSLDFSGSHNFSSAHINGNWKGNPAKVDKEFIVTGNFKNSGSSVDIGGNLCVGGNYDPDNNNITIGGGLYMGSTDNFVGNSGSYQDVYCNGDLKFGSTGSGDLINGSLTVNGMVYGFNGSRNYRINGSLVIGDPEALGNNLSAAYIDGNDLSGGSFVVCDSVWTMNPAGVQITTRYYYWNNNTSQCIDFDNSPVMKCRGHDPNKCSGTITGICDWTQNRTCDYNNQSCNPGDTPPICPNWKENNANCSSSNLILTCSSGETANLECYNNNLPDWENYQVPTCNNWNETTPTCELKENFSACERIRFNAGINSSDNCPSRPNAILAFNNAVSNGMPNLNYKTQPDPPVGYFWAAASYTTPPTMENKPAGGDSAKAYCDNKWRPKENGECGGSGFIIDDPIASSLDLIKEHLDTVVTKHNPQEGNRDFKCLSNDVVTSGPGGEVVVAIEGNQNITRNIWDLINDCYQQIKNNHPEYLYNGYYTVYLKQNEDYSPAGKVLDGKFIFIYPDQSGNVQVPPTQNDANVMMFLEKGIGGEFKFDPDACNDGEYSYRYFIYSLQNINRVNIDGKCPLNGNFYFPTSSCGAAITNITGDFTLEENPELVAELMEQGILCKSSDRKTQNNPYCTEQEIKDTQNGNSSSSSEEASSASANIDKKDEYWISISSRLLVNIENKEISKEKQKGSPESLKPLKLVMPRVVHLNPNSITNTSELKDYYYFVDLNDNTITKQLPDWKNNPPTPVCQGIDFSSKSLSECIFTNSNPNYNISNFYVNIGDKSDPAISSNSEASSSSNAPSSSSNSSSSSSASQQQSSSDAVPPTLSCRVQGKIEVGKWQTVPIDNANGATLECSDGSQPTNHNWAGINLSSASSYSSIKVRANCGGVDMGEVDCSDTLIVEPQSVSLSCNPQSNIYAKSSYQISDNPQPACAPSGNGNPSNLTWTQAGSAWNWLVPINAAAGTVYSIIAKASCNNTNNLEADCGKVTVAGIACANNPGNSVVAGSNINAPTLTCNNTNSPPPTAIYNSGNLSSFPTIAGAAGTEYTIAGTANCGSEGRLQSIAFDCGKITSVDTPSSIALCNDTWKTFTAGTHSISIEESCNGGLKCYGTDNIPKIVTFNNEAKEGAALYNGNEGYREFWDNINKPITETLTVSTGTVTCTVNY